MRIPDNLQPRRLADAFGISLGELALRLRISYHTLHGWSRRGSAPRTTVEWLEAQSQRIAKELAEERAKLSPVEEMLASTRPPKLITIPPLPDPNRPRLLKPRPRKER